MRRQVPRQVALLNERLPTMLALVRFLARMSPLMDHQLPFPDERQRTETALVGLLARMRGHLVSLPIRGVREHLVTELALVRPDSGVAPFVRQELRLDPERELADFTLPRFLVGVCHGVVLVVAFARERFAADFATEGTIRLMNNHVVLENGFSAKCLLTNVALVRFDTEMFVLVVLQLGQRFHLDATSAAGMSRPRIGLSLNNHVPQQTPIVAETAETYFTAVLIRVTVILELIPFHAMVLIHVSK